jgi:ABC-type maltose transport system permease subunit
MSDEIQKQTTEGITFRIPSISITPLREESKKKQVGLNTLVNQILKDHLDWHRYAAQARMFHVPRSTFSRACI